MKGERHCSRWAVHRATGRAAVLTWFRMFLTDEVMSEKTKRQRLSCKEKYELMKEVQGDSKRTDVFWMASTGGGVVRLWWGMARLKEETREFQYCSVSIIDSRSLPGVVLEKVRSNNCRWANCTSNCDFRGVQRVLMQNFRVRWGPVTTILFVDVTAEIEMVPNEPWNSFLRPSALP